MSEGSEIHFSMARDFVRLLDCRNPRWTSLGPEARFLLWRILRVKGYDRFAVSNVATLQKDLSYPRSPYAKAEKELIKAGILRLTPASNSKRVFNYFQIDDGQIRFLSARHPYDENSDEMDRERIATLRLLKLDAWLVQKAPFQNFFGKAPSASFRKFTSSARLLLLTLYGLADKFGKIEIGLLQLAKISGLSVQQVEYNLEKFLQKGFVLRHITGDTLTPLFGRVPGLICMNVCVQEIFGEITCSCVVLEESVLSRDDEGWGVIHKNWIVSLYRYFEKTLIKKSEILNFMDRLKRENDAESFYDNLQKDQDSLAKEVQKASVECENIDLENFFPSSSAMANFIKVGESLHLGNNRFNNQLFLEWVFKYVLISGAILAFPSRNPIARNLLELLIYRRTSGILAKGSATASELIQEKFGLLSYGPSDAEMSIDLSSLSSERIAEIKILCIRKIFWTYAEIAATASAIYFHEIQSRLTEKFPELISANTTIDLVPMKPCKLSHANAIDRFRICLLISHEHGFQNFYSRFYSRIDLKTPYFHRAASRLDDFADFQRFNA